MLTRKKSDLAEDGQKMGDSDGWRFTQWFRHWQQIYHLWMLWVHWIALCNYLIQWVQEVWLKKTYHAQTCVYLWKHTVYLTWWYIYTYIYICIYICIHIPYLTLSLIRVLQPKGSQLFFSFCIGWSSSVLIVASPGKPLTIAGWKTILSFWDGSFSGATVDDSEIPNNHLECKKTC